MNKLEEDSGFAVCSCGGLFDLVGVSIYDGHPRTHQPIPAPQGFVVSASAAEVLPPTGYREGGHRRERELTVTWPVDDARLSRGFLWVFVILFGGMTILSAVSAFEPQPTSRVEPVTMGRSKPARHLDPGAAAFVAAFTGIPALISTYLLLLVLCNRSKLTLCNGTLRIHHGPLPYLRDVSVGLAELDRIYCSREKSGQRNAFVSYALNARLRSGEVRPLLARASRPRTVLFLQQCVEEVLEVPIEPGGAARGLVYELDFARR